MENDVAMDCARNETAESSEAPVDDEAKKVQPVKGRTSSQILACSVVGLGNVSAGAVNGWAAGTLPLLQEDPDFVMNTANTAWVVSIVSLGCMVGTIFSGRILDWLGRRRTLMITAPLLIVSWLTVALAPNTAVLLVGRAACGFFTSFYFTGGPIYCSEVPEARLRGSLGLIPSLCITFGVVLAYFAGVFFTWRNSCYVCGTPIILMFFALWMIPESPYWYLLKEKRIECKKALKWLRGPNYDFSEELTEMEAKINSVGKKAEYRELWRPRTRKPFLISLFMSTTQQASGGNVLIMFTGVVFISAGVEYHQLATLATGLVQIVFTLVCVFTVDRVGRRPLIIGSTAIISSSTLVLGVYYLLLDVFDIHWPTWVPLCAVLVAVSGYCLACRTLPWLLAAELFNTTIRSTANSVTIFYNRVLNLLVLQVYPFYEEAFGSHTVFFTFGILCLLCCLTAYFLVPETKGKTLEEIQEYFESKQKKKKDFNQIGESRSDATSV